MASFFEDLRFAARMALRRPISTAMAVVSIALGIGANGAVFTLLDATVLRPLPGVEDPDRVLAVCTVREGEGPYPGVASYQDYRDYRHQTSAFADLAATSTVYLGLRAGDLSERVEGSLVTSAFFSTLGVQPHVGRLFVPDEEVGQPQPVAVLGYDLWRRRFGADPAAVGREVVLNGHSFTVIGVAQPGFFGVALDNRAEVWVPIRWQPELLPNFGNLLDVRGWRGLRLFGRLQPGASAEAARAEVAVVAERLQQTYPDSNEDYVADVVPLSELTLSPENRQLITMIAALLGVVSLLVLLLASVNVANLLLARAVGRRAELFVRQAIGVSRGRLLRQLLTENLFLAVVSGVVAVVVAHWSLRFLAILLIPASFRVELGLNLPALVLTLVLTLVTALLFGLAPALRGASPELVRGMQSGAAAPSGGRRMGLRKGLVVAQVAISLLLLVGFGLVLRTLNNLRSVDIGVDAKRVLATTLDLTPLGYSGPEVRGFYSQLLERLRGLPEVEAVSLVGVVPVSGDEEVVRVTVDGYDPAPDESMLVANNLVGPAFFRTVGMDLVEGRDFTDGDRADTARVAIVNETMAERFWPGRSPIGERLSIDGPDGPYAEVVGVARDGKYISLREGPRSFLFLPHLQVYDGGWGAEMTVLIRTRGRPQRLIPTVRREVAALMPDLPVYNVAPLGDLLANSMIPERALAMLLGAFAALALGLAVVGIYGVMSYSVAFRVPEIGIRMAVGARRESVLRLVLREGLTLVGIGLGLGLLLAWLSTKLLANLLYGVRSHDPVTFVATSVLLLLVAVVSTYLPARRATRVDPVEALRAS